MKNEISNRDYLEANLNEMITEMDTADAQSNRTESEIVLASDCNFAAKQEAFEAHELVCKLQDNMNTYIILIPDCCHQYARFDFEADDWRSTNDLAKAWTVDETTADEAAYKFRETFGIDQGSFTISATLLSEAIEDRAAYVAESPV